jgi:hypothetical protein
MPAGGCPLPKNQQPDKCNDCSFPPTERAQKCPWYRGMRQAITPFRMNLVSNGVLLLMFSITILTNQNELTSTNHLIIYLSLAISAILAFSAVLPFHLKFLSNGWVSAGIGSLVYIAWFFNFAMKWLGGIRIQSSIEQSLISWLGIAWLLVMTVILTRAFSILCMNTKSLKWLPFIIPTVMLWRSMEAFLRVKDPIAGVIMLAFVLCSTIVALGIWKPIGELTIGSSR